MISGDSSNGIHSCLGLWELELFEHIAAIVNEIRYSAGWGVQRVV